MATCLDRPRLDRRLGRLLLAACLLHALGSMIMWARQPPRRVMQGSGPSSHGSNRSVAAATPWPRTLHFIRWKTEPPDEALRSWRELHPTWNLTVWSEALVAQQFPDLPLESLVSNGSLRHALRFRILAEFGGIYIDKDITAIRPLDELLRHVQDNWGQAFSVCRELNQYHPNVRDDFLPCICIHTHIVCFEGGKKAQIFFAAAGRGHPGPLPSIRSRDDIIHLKTPYTFRHPTPGLAVGRRRRHGLQSAFIQFKETSKNKSSPRLTDCNILEPAFSNTPLFEHTLHPACHFFPLALF